MRYINTIVITSTELPRAISQDVPVSAGLPSAHVNLCSEKRKVKVGTRTLGFVLLSIPSTQQGQKKIEGTSVGKVLRDRKLFGYANDRRWSTGEVRSLH